MKRLVIGSAIALMFAAGIVDVDAGPLFGTGSGRSAPGSKHRTGWNDSTAKKQLDMDYPTHASDMAKASPALEAVIKNLEDIEKKRFAGSDTMKPLLELLRTVAVCYESILHIRKMDDITPDTEEAAAVVQNLLPLVQVVTDADVYAEIAKLEHIVTITPGIDDKPLKVKMMKIADALKAAGEWADNKVTEMKIATVGVASGVQPEAGTVSSAAIPEPDQSKALQEANARASTAESRAASAESRAASEASRAAAAEKALKEAKAKAAAKPAAKKTPPKKTPPKKTTAKKK
ncbi:hypothetical protein FACS189472_03550 [Alphaproteobacteria bacterium]|nr:hypothetical protein FACS189472_03550 [Alphaproteobacteria bacterium]